MRKKGDLIKFKSTGRFATIATEDYNHRDIDPECPQSVAIVTCFNVIMMDDGRERRIKASWPSTYEIISKGAQDGDKID